jgi:hypothetical protein
MKHSDDGIVIPKTITYSSELGPTTESLRIINGSPNTYVFKVNHSLIRLEPIRKLSFPFIPHTDSCGRLQPSS